MTVRYCSILNISQFQTSTHSYLSVTSRTSPLLGPTDFTIPPIGPTSVPFFLYIQNALKGTSNWNYLCQLLVALKTTTDKTHRSIVLQEASNVCHLKYIRAKATLKRQMSMESVHSWRKSGSCWFKRISKEFENGDTRMVVKKKPEILAAGAELRLRRRWSEQVYVAGGAELEEDVKQLNPDTNIPRFVMPPDDNVNTGMEKIEILLFEDYMVWTTSFEIRSLYLDLVEDCIAMVHAQSVALAEEEAERKVKDKLKSEYIPFPQETPNVPGVSMRERRQKRKPDRRLYLGTHTPRLFPRPSPLRRLRSLFNTVRRGQVSRVYLTGYL
ncbi:hypothetical protein F4678DRAFT_479103 [Xylaria arbuscula]|nr:hypothetical protein F4678DRAFT_479103 [Xylaria arbuscula]